MDGVERECFRLAGLNQDEIEALARLESLRDALLGVDVDEEVIDASLLPIGSLLLSKSTQRRFDEAMSRHRGD